MKVSELLTQLSAADPDLDVYVAPLKAFPLQNHGTIVTLVDPFHQAPAAIAAEYRPMTEEPPRLVIGYDTHSLPLEPQVDDDERSN